MASQKEFLANLHDLHDTVQDLVVSHENLIGTCEGIAWDLTEFKQLSVAGFETINDRYDRLEDQVDRLEARFDGLAVA